MAEYLKRDKSQVNNDDIDYNIAISLFEDNHKAIPNNNQSQQISSQRLSHRKSEMSFNQSNHDSDMKFSSAWANKSDPDSLELSSSVGSIK